LGRFFRYAESFDRPAALDQAKGWLQQKAKEAAVRENIIDVPSTAILRCL
jgi:hypothetical protein